MNINVQTQPPNYLTRKGTQVWWDDDHKLHRNGDLPALITSFGGQIWYCHGHLNRGRDRPG